MSNEVGLRLREIRRQLRMSQKELGEKFGIRASALSKHELGICLPTVNMMHVLAFEYNVSMDYLLCGRGPIFYKKQDRQLEDIISKDKEMEELFSLMSRVPLVRHVVLSHFHTFKFEKKEMIESAMKEGSAVPG